MKNRLIALFVVVASLVCTGAARRPTSTIQITDSEQRLLTFLQEGAADPIIGEWLMNTLGNRIRYGLDLEVNNTLRTHPMAIKLRRELAPALNLEIDKIRDDNMGTMALAQQRTRGFAGQYPEYFDLFQTVLTKLNFPQQAIRNMSLFVANAPDVNAYTYSPVPSNVQAVFFTSLLNVMPLDSVGAVMAHEATHILLGHVMNSVLLNAIFDATGEILITDPEAPVDTAEAESTEAGSQQRRGDRPADRRSPERRALQQYMRSNNLNRAALTEMVDSYSRQMLLSALGAECSHNCSADQRAISEYKTQIADRFLRVSKAVVREAIASGTITMADIRSMGRSLTALAASHNGDGDEGGSSPESEPSSDEEKPAKKFQRLMAALSRHQESSCDVAALLIAGPDATAEAFARLGGGTGANVEAMLRQYQRLMESTSARGLSVAEGNSHPTLISRVAHFRAYTQRTQYQVLTNPFLNALDIYFRLSNQLVETERLMTDGAGSLPEDQLMFTQRRKFTTLARNLAGWITERVVEEFRNNPEADPEKFVQLMEYVNLYAGRMDVTIPSGELTSRDRAMQQILRGLQALQGNDRAQRAAEYIRTTYGQSTGGDVDSIRTSVLDAVRGPVVAQQAEGATAGTGAGGAVACGTKFKE